MKRSVSFMMFFSFYLLSGAAFAEETSNMHKPHQHRHPGYASMKNPVAMTAQSIAEGKKLYDKNCMDCHGDAGKRDISSDLRVLCGYMVIPMVRYFTLSLMA
jgi:cytochrome c